MSFLKKVSRIAAPFASLIPGVGPFVSMGLGALGSLGGGGGSKSSVSNGMNSQLMQQLLSGVTQTQGMAKGSFDKGNSLIDAGMGTMGKATDYYSNILAGGPGANKALSGPISDLVTANNRGLQNTAQFGARGGTTASSMAQRAPQLGASISRLKTDSLDNAGKSLLSAGGAQAGVGTSLTGQGTGAFGETLSTLLGARGQDTQQLISQMGINAENNRGLGQGIGSILSMLLSPGGLLNKGTPTSGGSSRSSDITNGIRGILGGNR